MLKRIDQIDAQISELTAVTEELLAPYEEQLSRAESMPGWGRRSAEDAVAETGAGMTRFATAGHLVSRAGRAPLDKQSGKRKGQARHEKGNTCLGGVPGETAISAGRTQTREGARYRKLARSRGKAKACVAVGNTQLKAYHKLLSNPGMRYEDLGPDYYERQAATRRKVTRHIRQIQAGGFDVTIAPREPGPAEDAHASGGAA
jgi:transposase